MLTLLIATQSSFLEQQGNKVGPKRLCLQITDNIQAGE